MVYFMGRRYDNGNGPPLPPRIKAAFDYLDHVRMVTTQMDASLPARELTAVERSVEQAALRALQQYLLGEMDFVEPNPAVVKPIKRDEDDGTASAPTGCTT
jgi:hypothetical protein